MQPHARDLYNLTQEYGYTSIGRVMLLVYDSPYKIIGRKNEVVIQIDEDSIWPQAQRCFSFVRLYLILVILPTRNNNLYFNLSIKDRIITKFKSDEWQLHKDGKE